MLRSCGLFAAVLLAACGRSTGEPAVENPLERPPIDASRIRSVEEALTWGYRRHADADLNGDGQSERLVLTAEVELRPEGSPIWEDGHRWAAYVEAPTGERTLLYGAFVPNGFVEMSVLTADSGGSRRVLVLERTPDQLRALEVLYQAPDSVRLVSGAYYQLEEWVPGFATIP